MARRAATYNSGGPPLPRLRRTSRSPCAKAGQPRQLQHPHFCCARKAPTMTTGIETAYQAARNRYAEAGVDTDAAMKRLASVPISLHCWQGDDVEGFEKFGTGLGGGLAATGNYPGKARTPDELRRDASRALSLIPGKHRFNLHASYGEFGGKTVERDEIGPQHYAGWIDWAKSLGIGL